jgi:hypothetical protein
MFLLARFADLASLHPADSLLLFNAAQLTLRDEPSFAAHSAQDATLDNLLAKALEQLVLRFIWAKNHTRHVFSPPFVQGMHTF